MNQNEWLTIPVLPCLSLDETITFWQYLGFKTTYFQKSPYQYGVVERGGYALHFFRVKGLDPATSYSTCLVTVTNAYDVYLSFMKSFREHVGKVAHTGLPRISRMKPDGTRFTVTDPGGNAVIFISLGEKDMEIYNEPNNAGLTALQQAIAWAIRLRDFKNDDTAAAKALDKGLKNTEEEKGIDIAQALLIRAELANRKSGTLNDSIYSSQLRKISLTKEEISVLQKRLSIADDIAHFFAD
jgi:hypothetical protein